MATNFSFTNVQEDRYTISWTSGSSCTRVQVKIDSGSWTTKTGSGKSGSITITGAHWNTSYNVQVRCLVNGSYVTSSTKTVTTYDYPHLLSGMPFTIGEKVTLLIYNPLGRNYNLTLIVNNQDVATYSGTATQVSGFNDATTIANMYAAIPNQQQATYQVQVQYTSAVSKKNGGMMSINDAECWPTAGQMRYLDTNSTAVSITGDNKKIVQNKSQVTFIIEDIAVFNSATVASAILTVNGVSYSGTVSSPGSCTFTGIVINSAVDVTALFTITDSRGLTDYVEKEVTMLEYYPPKLSATAKRQNGYYANTTVTANAEAAYVGSNTINLLQMRSRQKGGTYGSWADISDSTPTVYSFDNSKVWELQFQARDSFSVVTTITITLPNGRGLIMFDRLKNAIGFNTFPNAANVFRFAGRIFTSFKDAVAIGSYAPAANTIPNLLDDVRLSSGCIGSVSITTAYTSNGITIPATWYNYIYIPHRTGGIDGSATGAGDNVNYGTLILSGMTGGKELAFKVNYDGGAIFVRRFVFTEDQQVVTLEVATNEIAANSYQSIATYSIDNLPSGYTPVGIVGVASTNWRIEPCSYFISGSSLSANFVNKATTSASATVTFYILCRR